MGKSLGVVNSILPSSVHPHARGEIRGYFVETMHASGSSPRTWGNLLRVRFSDRVHRFIPTHVGKSMEMLGSGSFISVHPHARGEIEPPNYLTVTRRGSSPRTWGNLKLAHVARLYIRFIPTHVGKSRSVITTCCAKTVHPHARGEIVIP